MAPRYRRVVIKLSGAALAGPDRLGLDSDALRHIAGQVLEAADLGTQVAMVVGGGNFFRGSLAEQWGIERAEADSIGMLGTVMNGLILRGALNSLSDREVRVMTAMPIPSVAEPFIRLRAIAHLERGALVVLAGGIGQPFVTTDYPSVQRALELHADALLVAKHGVDGVYTADPKTDPDARRLDTITYDEAIAGDLRVMDPSAFILARDHGLPIHVFDIAGDGTMAAIVRGEDVGTRITP